MQAVLSEEAHSVIQNKSQSSISVSHLTNHCPCIRRRVLSRRPTYFSTVTHYIISTALDPWTAGTQGLRKPVRMGTHVLSRGKVTMYRRE